MINMTDKIKYIRDLAIEYLDIELQLANDSLDTEKNRQYEIRLEQIADELRESDFF